MSAASNRRSGMLGRLVEWRYNVRAPYARAGELQNGDHDVGQVTRNNSFSRSDPYTITARHPRATDNLRWRLELLDVAMKP
jgi:hypothetical protein